MLDRKDSVGVEVLAVGIENVRRQALVSGSAHNHMEVRRSPGVPAGGFQHLTDRAVAWDGVGRWANAHEGVVAVCSRFESTSQVACGRGRVLDGIKVIGAVLPDV